MTISKDEYVSLLRQDFLSFFLRAFCELHPGKKFVNNWHVAKIAEMLDRCRRGEIKRLVISLPPRNAKSLCASVAFSAWLLGHNPNKHIICASYGQSLAEKHAEDTRRIMKSDWYEELFGKLLANRQSVNDFATLQQGSRMATSVGGALTGRGGDALIIDDPMKPSEALSDVERARVIEWFDHTLLSRLNDKENGVIIIIMQRLHQWDLIGHVLQHGDWEVLSFPAIAEKTETIIFEDIFGRHRIIRPEGQALNPALESLEALKDMRSRMGEYNFSAQYQQNPTPIGGTIIKREWLRFYEANELPERFSRIVMSWDTANKATELSDYSVCTIWGVHDRKCYLLNVIRKRLDYPNLKRKIIELAADYPSAQILIEDKASGTQLIQDLQYDGMHGIVPYTPAANTDKIMRLHAQSARFENGMVYLPKQAPWLDEYIRELMSFPSARYDDQVDSTTQALDYMRKRTSFEVFEALGRL